MLLPNTPIDIHKYILFLLLTLCSLLHLSEGVRWRAGGCSSVDSKKPCFCSGTHNGRSMAGSMNRFEDMKAMYENCTRISANLEITHLTAETLGWNRSMMAKPLTIFDHIEEVKGYILIYNVDLSILSFKNLKIIWGDELLDENTRDGALTISNNHNLKEVLMPNLRTVEKGNIHIENNTFLCYLRDKVLWDEILNYEDSRLIARPNGFRQCDHTKLASNIKCSPACEKDHCWSRDASQCQKLYRTICPEKCHLSKQCYRVRDTDDYDCCHATCAGGCTGPTAQDCLACKENSYNGVCVSKCPELMVYDRRTATRIPNPNGTYLYDRYCVDKCPDHLLIDGETCVRHCSIGKHHDMTKETRECEKCKGECPKVCYVDHPLTGSILRNLVDCEEIDGFIAILDSKMSSSDGYSVEDLYALKSVRMISEYIVISTVHLSPRNLSFLENLEFVEGRQLSNRRYALEITKNDLLSSLDLKSLKTIKNGHVIIAENVGLCYVDSVNWSTILANNSVAKISENQYPDQCAKRGKQCDSMCDSKYGCWGKGPGKCLKCSDWSLDGVCIPSCPKLGYYQNVSLKQCLPCHENCRECLGPSESECLSCKQFSLFDETFGSLQCLSECPVTHFGQHGQCLSCHPSCQEFGCTGVADFLGEGGCNKCTFALIDENKNVVRCLWGSEHDICQENNLTNYFGALTPIIEGVEKSYCEKCNDECTTCRFGGNSGKHDECLCKNYLVIERNESHCHSECTRTTYMTKKKESNAYGICEECHQFCDRNYGCVGGAATDCARCAKASITVNETNVCLAECPISAPFLVEPEMTCHKTDIEKAKRQRFYIFLTMIGISFLLAIVIIGVVSNKSRRINSRLKRELFENAPTLPESIEMDPSCRPNLSKVQIIPMSDLQAKNKVLGEGHFGVVYAGYYFPKGIARNEKLPVAIKLLRSVSPEQDKQVLEEAATMARLRHQNLLGLVGVCLSPDGIQLITLLRPLGCLLDFLRKHKNHLSGKDLLSYCYQISCAMKYLYDNRIVHLDLAARNVLVKNAQHVQVTDFGLSKLLNYGENKVERKGKVAFKWTALEALTTNSFSHATDVWAFGVTCWEILTFGQSPYQGMDSNSLVRYLQNGNRLSQPNNCSIEVYQLLIQCWVVNPESRPTFLLLSDRFREFCRVPTLYVVLNTSSIQGELHEGNQIDLIREIFSDSDSQFDDQIMNPEDYNSLNLDSPSPFQNPAPRNIRRNTSSGSRRYQPDPVSRPMLDNVSEDIQEYPGGEYLVPILKSKGQPDATMYTAVVSSEGEPELINPHDYYNWTNGPNHDYYNCATSENKKESDVPVDKESCL
ncbi:unnamed protein product [Auanema sp. JU1783]|nr:unnamed protein product [Auanema sp. JU1783]